MSPEELKPEQLKLPGVMTEKEIEPPKEKKWASPKFSADDLEPISCQYCEDCGPCTFCNRGREEIAKMKKKKNVA